MAEATPQQAPQTTNRRRRFDMILQIILALVAGGGISYGLRDVEAFKQLNGLYTTKDEGIDIKRSIKEIRDTQVENAVTNATAQANIVAANANTVASLAQLRAEMNTNFASLKLMLTDHRTAQQQTDDKQNLSISELRLLITKPPKPTKEN